MADKTSPSQENPQDSESDDEEVVETSPCGRWEKHRKEVNLVFRPSVFFQFSTEGTPKGLTPLSLVSKKQAFRTVAGSL